MTYLEISILSTLSYCAGAVTERILAGRKTQVCSRCFLRKAANEFHKPLFEVFHWPSRGPVGIRVFAGVNWNITLREGGKLLYARLKEKIMSRVR